MSGIFLGPYQDIFMSSLFYIRWEVLRYSLDRALIEGVLRLGIGLERHIGGIAIIGVGLERHIHMCREQPCSFLSLVMEPIVMKSSPRPML